MAPRNPHDSLIILEFKLNPYTKNHYAIYYQGYLFPTCDSKVCVLGQSFRNATKTNDINFYCQLSVRLFPNKKSNRGIRNTITKAYYFYPNDTNKRQRTH